MKQITYGNIVYLNQDRYWHRIGAPAVEYIDGEVLWLFHGKYHKINGLCRVPKKNYFSQYRIYNEDISINIDRLVI